MDTENILEQEESVKDIILSNGTEIGNIISISSDFIKKTLDITLDSVVDHSVFNNNLSPVTILGTVYDSMELKSIVDTDEQTHIVLSIIEENTRIDALEESQDIQDEIIADILDTI